MTFRFLLRLETVSLHENELQNNENDKYAPTMMYFMRKSEDKSSVLMPTRQAQTNRMSRQVL